MFGKEMPASDGSRHKLWVFYLDWICPYKQFLKAIIQPCTGTGAARAQINGNKGKAWPEGHVGHTVPAQSFTSGRGSPERFQKTAGVGNRNSHPMVTCWDCPGGRISSGQWGLGNIPQEGLEWGRGSALPWGEGNTWKELCQGDQY